MSAALKRENRTEDTQAIEPPLPVGKPWSPTGKRRPPAPTLKARRLQWPRVGKERFEVLDLWFYVAIQIGGPSVAPTLLALRKLVMADSGSTWASNETIARWAGYLSLAKVKRDIATLIHRGLIESELGWREDGTGKWKKTRTMFLAIPDPLPSDVRWPRSWAEFDVSTLEEGLPRGANGTGKKRRSPSDNRLHVSSKEGLPRGAITLKGNTSTSSERNQNVASADRNPYASAKAKGVEPGSVHEGQATDPVDPPDHSGYVGGARPKRASRDAQSFRQDLDSER